MIYSIFGFLIGCGLGYLFCWSIERLYYSHYCELSNYNCSNCNVKSCPERGRYEVHK